MIDIATGQDCCRDYDTQEVINVKVIDFIKYNNLYDNLIVLQYTLECTECGNINKLNEYQDNQGARYEWIN